jgi:hypothetical protein
VNDWQLGDRSLRVTVSGSDGVTSESVNEADRLTAAPTKYFDGASIYLTFQRPGAPLDWISRTGLAFIVAFPIAAPADVTFTGRPEASSSNI